MRRISEDLIKRTVLGERREIVIRDTQLTGFTLRIRRGANGGLLRTFMVLAEQAKPGGKRQRRKFVIGSHPTWTAEKAREQASEMLRAIGRGEDPAAIKAEKRAAPRFPDLVTEFSDRHLATLKPATQRDYRLRISRVLMPTFEKVRVADISPAMVRELVRAKRSNPIDANRALAVLSSMMRTAMELGWRDDNPCRGVKRYAEKARDKWLDEHDLPKFVEALASAEGPHAEAIRFMTVTGWRVSEVTGLRWDMIDLPRLIARLDDTKTGAQVRALSTDAATIVDRQPHRHGWVFSGSKGWRPLGYRKVSDTLKKVCEAAGIAPITPHVLRHTAATWAAIGGAQAHELREAFGWKTLAMTSRYVSRSEALGRRGAERAAAAINIHGRPVATVERLAKDG